MATKHICDECGAELPVNAPEGLCPRCLVGMGVHLAPGKRVAIPLNSEQQIGERIGHYKILQKIGEGGCGVVYMAEQEEPVRRRVALKVIKLGMDTRQVIARFEAERQALAMMDHPNIAKVLDAGASEAGRPYFVMELVRGIKVTDYCDQNNLSTEHRLELFLQVCKAIQHAHQKGIIHRDIKPSNILVTLHDGVPVPKVIDFGIAKATQGRLTDQTLFTAFEQFIGTPAYMSPEQAEMSGLDIDTRSDLYSLGVLLYELLTGETPFDTKELLALGLDEMRRTIREREPALPSTRLSTMGGAALTSVAKHRQAEPGKLTNLIRGDLDWIVMKALEKDRTRRYETVNGLALDVQRYLNNEPVEARPQSAVYRFLKLVERNKLAFAAVIGISLSLLSGLGVSTWLFLKERETYKHALVVEMARRQAVAEQEAQARLRWEAETARANEVRLRLEAETAQAKEARLRLETETVRVHEAEAAVSNDTRLRLLAVASEQKAETESTKSEQVSQYLKDLLADIAPSLAKGCTAKYVRGVLDRVDERVGKELSYQPEVEAAVRTILGEVQADLSEDGKAEANFRRALALQSHRQCRDYRDAARAAHGLMAILSRQKKCQGMQAIFNDLLTPDIEQLPQCAILLTERANFFARRAEWEKARADVTKAMEFEQTNQVLYRTLTALLVAGEDREAYRRNCRQTIARFGGTRDSATILWIIEDSLILPASGVELRTIQDWLETMVATNLPDASLPRFQLLNGLAKYRLGNFDEVPRQMYRSITRSERLSDSYCLAEAYIVLAMAHFQTKDSEQARDDFAHGAELMRAKLPPLGSGDLGENWRDCVFANALQVQAQALMEGAPRLKDHSSAAESAVPQEGGP